MSNRELQAKARELKELKRMAEELEAEITAIEDTIRTAMGEREEITTGEYKITLKPASKKYAICIRDKPVHPYKSIKKGSAFIALILF
jgi:uncharacterized protein (UPF0305 family)